MTTPGPLRFLRTQYWTHGRGQWRVHATSYTAGVGFAKVVLVVVIILAIVIALMMRFRAWKQQRDVRRARWQAELDRDLRE